MFEEVALETFEAVAILVIGQTVSNGIDALTVHEHIRQGTKFTKTVDRTQTVWVDDLLGRVKIDCSVACGFGCLIVDRSSNAVALLKLISGITAFA